MNNSSPYSGGATHRSNSPKQSFFKRLGSDAGRLSKTYAPIGIHINVNGEMVGRPKSVGRSYSAETSKLSSDSDPVDHYHASPAHQS